MQPPFNISLYPGTGTADGRKGDHVIIAPAYNITADDVRHIVDTTVAVIRQYFLQNHRDWLLSTLGDVEAPPPSQNINKPRK